tara:strand:+ start:8410 stop:10566 length:2157 start_codon:yes stop_codon:yes gene_type:complete
MQTSFLKRNPLTPLELAVILVTRIVLQALEASNPSAAAEFNEQKEMYAGAIREALIESGRFLGPEEPAPKNALSWAEIMAAYEHNEDVNAHSENYVLLAEALGKSPRTIQVLKDILAKRDRGHGLSADDVKIQREFAAGHYAEAKKYAAIEKARHQPIVEVLEEPAPTPRRTRTHRGPTDEEARSLAELVMRHARDHYEDGWDSVSETMSIGDIAEIIKEEGARTPRKAVEAIGEGAEMYHEQLSEARGAGGMSTPPFKMRLSSVPTKKQWMESEQASDEDLALQEELRVGRERAAAEEKREKAYEKKATELAAAAAYTAMLSEADRQEAARDLLAMKNKVRYADHNYTAYLTQTIQKLGQKLVPGIRLGDSEDVVAYFSNGTLTPDRIADYYLEKRATMDGIAQLPPKLRAKVEAIIEPAEEEEAIIEDLPFMVGETLLSESPHDPGHPIEVSFRGKIGGQATVEYDRGRQMTVPLEWLSRPDWVARPEEDEPTEEDLRVWKRHDDWLERKREKRQQEEAIIEPAEEEPARFKVGDTLRLTYRDSSRSPEILDVWSVGNWDEDGSFRQYKLMDPKTRSKLWHNDPSTSYTLELEEEEEDEPDSGAGAVNAKYLDSLPSGKKAKILKHLANHYGVSLSEIEDEVKDRDAENLFEYTATDRAMSMEIYNDFVDRGLLEEEEPAPKTFAAEKRRQQEPEPSDEEMMARMSAMMDKMMGEG